MKEVSGNNRNVRSNTNSVKKRIFKIAIIVFIAVLAYTIPATFSLDFIRDTEADRTLISMEMAKGSSWSVPSLLGQEFMTKPPGFYWAQAISLLITGSEKEWAARLPSAVATAIMVTALFLFMMKEGVQSGGVSSTLKRALTTAAILTTSGAVFKLSTLAEIDMCFAMLVTLSLLSGYYITTSVSLKGKCLGAAFFQLFAALAFLTKGPPVFLFSWGPVGVFFVVHTMMVRSSEKLTGREIKGFAIANLVGLAVFILVTGLWVNAVVNELGAKKVLEHLDYQVVKRVSGSEHAGRSRGPLYYLGAIGTGSIPWTPFLILALYQVYVRKTKDKIENIKSASDGPNLPLIFALSMIIPSFIGLSVVAGKASRYMLLLWLFFAIIAAQAIHLWQKEESKKLKVVAGITLTVMLLRIPWCLVYVPKRNASSSPRPVAASINEIVPEKEPIYILALMERWTCYYLITSEKRTVLRISPEIIDKWKSFTTSAPVIDSPPAIGSPPVKKTMTCAFVYILIHKDKESWKLKKLIATYRQTKVLKDYIQNKRNFQIIRTTRDAILECAATKDFLGRK